MHSDLEKLVSRGKIDTTTAEQLQSLEPGTYCYHKSWGPGKIVTWDRLNLKVVVDFENKEGHELGMKFAAQSLTPLPAESFLAKRFSSRDELADMAKSDPIELVRLALNSQGGKLSVNQLEDFIKGTIVPDGKYKSWWESTKRKLRDDLQFVVPAKRTDYLELRSENLDPAEAFLSDFREARDLKAKLRAIDAIIKEIGAFDGKEEQLSDLVDEISDTAKKGLKLQFVPAVELVLIREDLRSKMNDQKERENQITIPEIVAENQEQILTLLADLSLTRLRQVLKSYPAAFPEDWIPRILSLVSTANLRVIVEIANFLIAQDKRQELLSHIADGLQQRSLSSDGLAWVCRERKGTAVDLFDNAIGLTIMSSLESDQLNDEGLVRSANRLRDLVADDRDLIPDLVKDANPATIRNFTSRLINLASFDELTRKSLVARVIKLHPGLEDLLSGRDHKQDEALVVSEESLAKRKEAYDRLIKEEIPQNREDIKIARSYGDLRENFEYKSAKDYQRVLMKRQGDWEKELKLAQPTDFSNVDSSCVSIGTIVTLEPTDGGEPLTYTVLGAWDSDPEKGVIAYLSDRGTAILGKKVGEEAVFASAEGKEERYQIADIRPYRS